MNGVVGGFATIGTVVALGAILAQFGVLDAAGQQTLSTLSFYVATPALLIVILQDTDISGIASVNLAASAIAVTVVVTLYSIAAVTVFRQPLAEATIGALCSSYVNAGNLGVPIAAYVLGDVALVAPTLLLQTIVMQTVGLTILDAAVAERKLSWAQIITRPLRTPLTVASAVGMCLSATDTQLPAVAHQPLALIGGMAVPGMLLAYGVSLRLGPKPGAQTRPAPLVLVALLKIVIQPLVAFASARFLGASHSTVLAVTVLAALPTAQNIFVSASRYSRGAVLARDAVFITTVSSVPAIAVITYLLN